MKRLPYVDLKYVRWVSIVLAVGLLTVASVSAHAPSEIHLAYDSPTQTLQVTIVHSVSDPATHYIEFVSIKKNGTFSVHRNIQVSPPHHSLPTHSRSQQLPEMCWKSLLSATWEGF